MTLEDRPNARPIFSADEMHLAVPERDLTPAECWSLWQEVYDRPDLDPTKLRSYRIVVAWRLTRSLAFKLGLLNLNERISAIDEEHWVGPTATGVQTTITSSEPGNWALQDLLAREGGLPLLPPERPGRERERFCWAILKIAESIRLHEGTKKFPELGHYGLQGMAHPDTMAEVWPSPGDILFFEEDLVNQLCSLVIKRSRAHCEEWLRERFGLTIREARGMIALGVDEARRGIDIDMESKRAIAEARIEDYIDRAREAGDLNNEMKGHKMLSMVQGLTRADPEDQMDIFIGTIGKVANERLEPPPTLRITVDEPKDTE